MPIIKNFNKIIHGADYNPEQWLQSPEIIEKDMDFLDEANMNSLTVGVFSWATLEPEEGKFDFSFLDDIMDKLAKKGAVVVLSTPSGGRPNWLADKYPEVLRVNASRVKHIFGERHNHCYTSPIYREKVQKINTLLAERYKNHPALGVWHLSNEYGGECHCELCQQAFRNWLKVKYNDDLDELNFRWWTTFWSHKYTSWAQIVSPSPIGEVNTHGLNLDWKRFVTYQTTDFIKNEMVPLKKITPDIPVTTNFMCYYEPLDYWKIKDALDVISWDNYPEWHNEEEPAFRASKIAMSHDINRSYLQKPYMLMESAPSSVNWKNTNKLLRPGMHELAELQAVSHGADTVQYFQFRKSRGSSEKFHAAVVDHVGHTNTRVFSEIKNLGKRLQGLSEIVDTNVNSEVAIIYDNENLWAINDAQGYQLKDKKYLDTCQKHQYSFWQSGVSIDCIDSEQDFSKYKLVVAPMLYMIKKGVAQKIEDYVKNGGTIVFTYISGVADENDLCYLGGMPAGNLKEVFGIWVEETDSLYGSDMNFAVIGDKEYKITEYCDLLHTTTAQTLAIYKNDFYAGRPCLTKNNYGAGQAYYISFRDNGDFLNDFYSNLIDGLSIAKNINAELKHGVTAQKRGNFIFLQNFNDDAVEIALNQAYTDYETKNVYSEKCLLNAFEVKILCVWEGEN